VQPPQSRDPILDVEKVRTELFLKRSMASGNGGADNELFSRPNTMMLVGDAEMMTEESRAGAGVCAGCRVSSLMKALLRKECEPSIAPRDDLKPRRLPDLDDLACGCRSHSTVWHRVA
jgi:hypothetical protein